MFSLAYARVIEIGGNSSVPESERQLRESMLTVVTVLVLFTVFIQVRGEGEGPGGRGRAWWEGEGPSGRGGARWEGSLHTHTHTHTHSASMHASQFMRSGRFSQAR